LQGAKEFCRHEYLVPLPLLVIPEYAGLLQDIYGPLGGKEADTQVF
jgi:hypothetical protein